MSFERNNQFWVIIKVVSKKKSFCVGKKHNTGRVSGKNSDLIKKTCAVNDDR